MPPTLAPKGSNLQLRPCPQGMDSPPSAARMTSGQQPARAGPFHRHPGQEGCVWATPHTPGPSAHLQGRRVSSKQNQPCRPFASLVTLALRAAPGPTLALQVSRFDLEALTLRPLRINEAFPWPVVVLGQIRPRPLSQHSCPGQAHAHLPLLRNISPRTPLFLMYNLSSVSHPRC